MNEPAGVSQLGQKTELPSSPDKAVLECVTNPQQERAYCIRFTVPEFSSLCPVTGAPDFAHLVIDYVPDRLIVESKSLKLLMGSFRNHGAFHEACTNLIADRMWNTIQPYWLRVAAYFEPRGGIPIDVFTQRGKLPDGQWIYIPRLSVPGYHGRG